MVIAAGALAGGAGGGAGAGGAAAAGGGSAAAGGGAAAGGAGGAGGISGILGTVMGGKAGDTSGADWKAFGMDMAKKGASSGGGGGGQPSLQSTGLTESLAASVSNMMSDKGFYTHMTVDSCRKNVKIIGTGVPHAKSN